MTRSCMSADKERYERKSIFGPAGKMPNLRFEPPMLATLVRTLPEGLEWEYEVKLPFAALRSTSSWNKL
jgi:hypothetical protein